ncbi:MAG: hypothetical protein MJ175_03055 [Clostridia bacterium]|nr:hypothetical protein [Clostridia bacterium]
MKHNVSALAGLLAVLLASSAAVACGDTTEKPSGGTNAVNPSAGGENEAVTQEIDPFADFDFGGETIRMHVSANDYDGWGSSIYTIRHEEGETGDIVRDAVYKRNTYVEDLLNVKFEFSENTNDYNAVSTPLKRVISAGDDAYDLIIHDLFPLASMSVEGYFLNVREGKYFDFSQPWWYTDYMDDLSFHTENRNYIMAGDFYMDILRSAHALYFNKDMFSDLFESPSELYDHVRAGTWTQDVFMSYAQDAYNDLNGNGQSDKEDQFGFGYIGTWGSMIPWVISSDITFLSYASDGAPSFAMNNERSVELLERLNKIFYADCACNFGDVPVNTAAFTSGRVLFGGYQRVSSLELFRDMTADIGVLPYPKMDESQKNYITSSHDTANVGVIPITCGKLDTMSAVLEVLSRETYKYVMPAYYETALKVKYSRDDDSAQMLDIIRGNISCVFPIAYGNYCYDMPLGKAFSTPLTSKKTDFASNYAKSEGKAQDKLDTLWEAFSAIES